MIECIACGVLFAAPVKPGRKPGYCTDSCRRAEKLRRFQATWSYVPEKNCIHCGERIKTPKGTRGAIRDYCSRKCSIRAGQNTHRSCVTCSNSFVVSFGRGNLRDYCSTVCYPKRTWSYGYVTMIAPGHPLDRGSGSIFEHRYVLYNAIGPGPHPCHWCGKLLRWDEHYNGQNGLGVDHLDYNTANNAVENLVPACRSCNVKRRRNSKTATEDGGFGRTHKAGAR